MIGHAGLGRDLPGGAPDAGRLRGAAARVDRLELDVVACRTGELLVLHDTVLPGEVAVATASLGRCRQAVPWLLTLDEAVELTAGLPLLLDVKGLGSALPLGGWLRDRGSLAGRIAVCTDDSAALMSLRHAAPRVARWRTLPDVGDGPGHRRRTAAAALLRSRLAARLPHLVREVGAVGLCCDRLVVSPALVGTAHHLGLEVTAWTVNSSRWARWVARAGVDLVTTDHPEVVRAAV